MKKVLTIAGSDSSAGAGIQADLKTITSHKLYGMTAITALTAQNTTGVFDIMPISDSFLKAQLVSIFEDIFPDAIKIGMISTPSQVTVIADVLRKYCAKNIVLDPVMIATSGSILSDNSTVNAMKKELFPLADIITPNIIEAEALNKIKITSIDDMILSGEELFNTYKCNILIKGGHLESCCDDLLFCDSGYIWFKNKRIDNQNTHGTGCTLSSAIACGLAAGYNMEESVSSAKKYITGAIMDGLNIGKGQGPLNHMYKYK